MPPAGVKRPKRKRQYAKVLKSIRSEGRYKGREKEVAARVVNKTKRRKGEARSTRSNSGSRKRSSARSASRRRTSSGSRKRK